MIYDFCVIGGGIVGLASAMQLLEQRPSASLLLLEKEDSVGQHQTGHNSGVIHAGIYYEPKSLKAQLCRAGLAATMDFCREHQLPFEACGKLIVATNPVEEQRIEALFQRATANGLKLERLSGAELNQLEPNVRGSAALLSRETGMVDYVAVCRKMAELITRSGAEVKLGARVTRIREQPGHVEVGVGDTTYSAGKLVVCGGLQADRLARMSGMEIDFHIVPFRGEYFRLPADKNEIVEHHIYPAPDPSLPFLGVHLTRMIDGGVTVGPNAVIGFAREGYPKLSINPADVLDYAAFPGFWKLIAASSKHAVKELYGSLWRLGYLAECRKYCPSLTLADLQPHRAGIRAQAVMKDGQAIHDFLFKQSDRIVHVCNAPSPAATSAIPIGKMIAERTLAA
jgi:L-2-hydroxyglutarate oxidase